MSGEAGKQPVVALAATHLPNAPGGDESWTRFGALANPAYLWLKRGEGPAVTEVKIVYGEEAAADGWVRVPEDLNSSSVGADRKPVFLHYRVGGETSPILDLKVYTTHDPIVGPGFARIEEILNPEADKNVAKEHLCFKTVASQAKLDAADYKVGDMIDCKDTANNWCQAQIMAVKGDQVLVHYKGWSEKWDEWMDRKSKRIAPYRSKTLGRATGWEGDREAFMLKEKEKEFMEVFNKTEEIVGRLEGASEFKELSKDEVFFLTTQNLQFLLNCLNSICDDQELLAKVQRFFERNLFLAVTYLKNAEEVPQQILEGVVKIFKGDPQYTRLYTKYGVKGGEPNLKGNFAMRPATQVAGEDKLLTSAYLIWMLNYFGDLGGFDAIAKRLTDPKFKGDSFFNVALMVKALAVSRGLFTPEFGPTFVKSLELPAMLPASLRRITDHELKTLTKDAIKDLAKDCEHLLNMKGSQYKSTEVAELMERVNVDIALRLLTAKVLEKRLNGCVEIEETIKRVIRKERPGSLPPVAAQSSAGVGLGMGVYGPAAPGAAGGGAAAADPGPAQYLTSEYLIKWIEENKVVDILLGAGSHEQIIKRSPAVLKFLASNGALTVEHIDALWASSIDKHEGLVRIVYDTLADLAQELNDEQLDALYSRISVVSFADYTDFILDFIKKFTVSAVKATKVEGKWFGLDLFWQLLQEDAKVSPSVAQHAAQTLKELLEQPLFEKQRLVYLDKCLENITSGVSVVPSLRLAKTIIAMYPVQSTANAPSAVTIGKLMEHLNSRNILKIVLDDLVRYDHEAQKALAAEGKEKENKGGSGNGPERDVLIGGTPHYSVNLQTRLDFIDFLLSCSDKLHLDQAGIDTLWSVFVTSAVTKDDKTLLLTWLNAVVTDDASRRPFPAFDTAVANYVFAGLLCNPEKLDYVTLPKLGYECFETYFVHVNHVSGALLTTSRRFMAIGDFHKLVGLPSLWQVAGSARDPAVAAQAKHFLTTMHIKLDYKYTPAEKKAIFKGFVDQAMQTLTEAARAIQTQAPDVEAQKHRAGAVLDIIDLFLERCHNGETIEQPKYKEGESVQASWKGGSRMYEAKVVRVNREGTYWLHYADGDVDQACPETSMKPLVEKTETKAPRDNETNDYPKFILSNEKAYFDLLFELLGAGGELSPKVWRLLERLPTNQDLADKIRALNITDASGNKDWNILLPTGRIIKLLYSLQIVDSNLQVQEGDEGHRKEVHDWSQAFLTQGGFAHIYSILAGADERAMVAEPLQQRCLMYLLKLVNHFINPASALDAPAALGTVDLAALEARLLNVIAASAEVKSTPPAPKPAARAIARPASPTGRGRTIGPLPAEGEGEAAAAAPIVEDATSLLVTQAFAVLSLLLNNKPETLETVYAFGGWKNAISAGLISNHSPAYRRALTHGIFGICSQFNKSVSPRPPRTFFLPELLKCLPDLAIGNGTGPVYCTEFFSLLQGLLKGSNPEDGSIDPKALAEQVADRIKKHPIVEKRLDDHDEVLNGFFNVASTLASKYPELKPLLGGGECGLLEEVFHCLFDVPATTASAAGKGALPPPKCKAAKTRKNAFALLAELAKGCPANQAKLTAMLLPNHTVSHSGGRYPSEWAFESKTEEKSDTGYVGLKNLGCICYMNALIQQLFMLPDLRANLLAVELDEKKDPDPKESVLYQLQSILANLQESEKQYYNPEGFCYAFKDFDGKPTNVSIQEDAAGFYTRLIDKINEMVKGTPYADCIKDVLGGTFAHEFIGKGCPHYREREEEFYTVQLQVQNKKTMEEALQSFVQGEMLEGDNAYKCGVCNKKVDTLKRTCLKTLPPTVAFVLKRFELDYNTLQTTKLNNRLEFPVEIDLKPYCKESLAHPFPQQQAAAAAEAAAAADGKAAEGEGDGKSADGKAAEGEKPEEPVVRPDDYYKYELRGVVVHTGSATHGHYYSFIRERTADEDGNPAPGRWFEFNDTIVRPFDPKDIPGECFGGTETGGRGRSQYAGMGSASNMVQGPSAGGYEKSRSGYVLFYDRVKTKDTMPAKPKETADKAPPKILQQIWQNNVIYWRDKAVFDPVYFDFLHDLLAGDQKEGEGDDEDATAAAPAVALSGPLRPADCPDNIKLATMFVLNTLTRAFHKQSLRNWVSLLHRLYARNPTAAAWLLDTFTKTKWTQEFLLGCTDPDVRNQIGAFLCYALSLVSPHEQASYDLPLPAESKEGKVATDDNRGVVVRFIDGVVRLLRFCPESWKNFDPYWRVLAHFAGLGHKEALYLHQHNFVAKLIDFYLGDSSPMPEVSDIPVDSHGKRRPIGDAWAHPDTTNFVLLLRSLVCAVALSEEQLAAGTPAALEGLAKGAVVKTLSSSAHSLLLSRQFLGRVIFEANSRKKGLAVVDILGHICWENEKLSQNIIGMVVMAVESAAYDYLRPLMRCLMGLVLLADSIQATRVDMVLNSLLAVMKGQARFWKPTDFCTEHLIRMAKKSDAVYKWLYEHQGSFDWLLGWIKANPKPPGAYDNTAQTVLHKPGKGPVDRSYGGQYSSASLYPTHEGLTPRHKMIALQLIKDGTALGTEDASDSDVDLNDREFEVGQWVDVLDTANKWLCAQVVEVRKDGTVRVHYDGWPDKWNQNIDKSSPRIQPLGKHTTKADWKLRGKPHPKEA